MLAPRFAAWTDPLRRLMAAGGALLVLALTVLAANPRLHEKLHADDPAPHTDGCAVVLFANGVALTVALTPALPAVAEWRVTPAAVVTEIFLAAPRYLRQPERGPPALG